MITSEYLCVMVNQNQPVILISEIAIKVRRAGAFARELSVTRRPPFKNTMENNSGNANQASLSNLNSPSKIPAPRSRSNRSIFNGDSALAPLAPPANAVETAAGIGQKRKQLERSPPKNPAMGGSRAAAAQAAQSSIASANVRTYRANATGTTRPPVTKTTGPVTQRNNIRGASNANASSSLFTEALSEIEQIANNKKRPNWDTRVPSDVLK